MPLHVSTLMRPLVRVVKGIVEAGSPRHTRKECEPLKRLKFRGERGAPGGSHGVNESGAHGFAYAQKLPCPLRDNAMGLRDMVTRPGAWVCGGSWILLNGPVGLPTAAKQREDMSPPTGLRICFCVVFLQIGHSYGVGKRIEPGRQLLSGRFSICA